MNNIYEVKETCTSCTACLTACKLNAIQFKPDKDGFYYPVIDEAKCVNCGKCLTVCAANGVTKPEDPQKENYYGYSEDETVRKESSSGGVFTELAKAVENAGGIIIGAYYDEKEKQVRHGSANLEKLRRSKYVESFMADTMKEISEALVAGKKVLFCGTPCQAAGVRYAFPEEKNLYIVDFICHGVPSMKMLREDMKLYEKSTHSSVKDLNFRPKTQGWSKQFLKYSFEKGKKKDIDANINRYFWSFFQNNCLRKSCYSCKYQEEHCSDIILADFWGYIYFDKTLNDEKGLSLIQVRTEQGKQLLEECRSALCLTPLDEKHLAYTKRNSNRYSLAERNRFYEEFNRSGYRKAVDSMGFQNDYNSRRIKSILSSLKFHLAKYITR